MLTCQEVKNIRVRSSEDLCALVEKIGYKGGGRFAINQLQCSNGAFASSLLRFFDDNPGAMEAVQEWIADNADSVTDDKEEIEEEVG